MLGLIVPNDARIHSARAFFLKSNPYQDKHSPGILELHPRWVNIDPFALSMIAAWGGWCRRNGINVKVENLGGNKVNYAARMKLFQYLGVDYNLPVIEHEEAGRFLPLRQVQNHTELTAVIANISALLHLDKEPDALAAVQYCISELISNVLEHSGSPEGAYVCAQRFPKEPKRVTVAVADCGRGIATHLSTTYPEALKSGKIALGLAMRPGVTGALRGVYGTPENAGAGLFITRSIAKGSGGYFLLQSGDVAYRLKRSNNPNVQIKLYFEALDEPRHDLWALPSNWLGTTVAVEIRTDRIEDFQGFFQWIRKQMPTRKALSKRIKFT